MEDFVGAKFYCLHALADNNQHIRIREKTLVNLTETVCPIFSTRTTQDREQTTYMNSKKCLSTTTTCSHNNRAVVGGPAGPAMA